MNQGPPPFPFPPEMLMLVVGLACAVGLAILVTYIFYLLTLSRALAKVSPRHRLMEPGMVWINLIPCVNIVWAFFVAIRVPDSLKAEFQARGRDDGSDYGKTIAVTNCILHVVGQFLGNGVGRVEDMQIIAGMLSGILLIAQLALGIIFWMKIANYSKMLDMDDDARYREFDRRLDEFDDDREDPDGDRDRDRPTGDKPSDAIKEGEGGSYERQQ
jgi:hypothetical protein